MSRSLFKGADLDPKRFLCRQSQLEDQIDVLNDAYSNMGITWVLADVDYTINSDWFNSAGPDTSEQDDMKSSLRTGGKGDLNVYTVG